MGFRKSLLLRHALVQFLEPVEKIWIVAGPGSMFEPVHDRDSAPEASSPKPKAQSPKPADSPADRRRWSARDLGEHALDGGCMAAPVHAVPEIFLSPDDFAFHVNRRRDGKPAQSVAIEVDGCCR